MEFTFSNNRWVLPEEPEGANKDFALGMHIPKRWDKILDINECHLMPKIGTEILNKTQSLSKELQLKPYDQKTHNGFLRYLILRFGHFTKDILVNIVTSYENIDLLQPLVDGLKKSFPEITTIVNNINTRKADVSFGEYEIHLYGKPALQEKLGDIDFEISANSFFQTNSPMAEQLYQTAVDAAKLNGNDVVYDLYCGTGSIAMFIANKVKEVHGFEVIVSAVEDATRNAVQNGIGNVFFHVANLDNFFKFGKGSKYPRPDVIFIDPPRAGMHKFMTNYLPKFEAKKIVYISCNPSTQARDAAILQTKGYTLDNLAIVDLFPHTPHIESVGVFKKK
jgi:23S rRNA (uracil1939-C5)-methyltransferase